MLKAKNIIIPIIMIIVISITGVYALIIWRRYVNSIHQAKEMPKEQSGSYVTIEKFQDYSRIVPSPSMPLSLVFERASKDAGFHIYYPTVIPPSLDFNRTQIAWSPETESSRIGRIASYNLGDINSQQPWIAIVQKPIQSHQENSLLARIDHLQSKHEISIQGDKGFIGITQARGNTFYHLIYTTKDSVVIWIWSKHFDFDTLTKIALSMK